MKSLSIRLLLAFALVLPASGAAWAQSGSAIQSPEGYDEVTADDDWDPRRRREVGWSEDWRKVQWWGYAGIGVLGVGGVIAKTWLTPPDKDVLGEAALFDRPLYDAIKPSKESTWKTHHTISDIGFYGSMSFLFADAIITGFAHDWELGYQMLMIDLEALSLVGGSLWWPHYFGLGRERPGYSDCGTPDEVGTDCSDTEIQYRSWYAGHPATAMAAAGTTCTHHYFNPIYGGIGDGLICGAMIGVATITGIERAVTGRHWPTDVLGGWAIGAAAGWLVPIGLHYGFRGQKRRGDMSFRIAPTVYQGDHAGFALMSRF